MNENDDKIRYWKGKFRCYMLTDRSPMKTALYVMLTTGEYILKKFKEEFVNTWNVLDKMVFLVRNCWRKEK